MGGFSLDLVPFYVFGAVGLFYLSLWTVANQCRGKIKAARVYDPVLLTIVRWPRLWRFQCGCCYKRVKAFGFFGAANCPRCGRRNYFVNLFTVCG